MLVLFNWYETVAHHLSARFTIPTLTGHRQEALNNKITPISVTVSLPYRYLISISLCNMVTMACNKYVYLLHWTKPINNLQVTTKGLLNNSQTSHSSKNVETKIKQKTSCYGPSLRWRNLDNPTTQKHTMRFGDEIRTTKSRVHWIRQ